MDRFRFTHIFLLLTLVYFVFNGDPGCELSNHICVGTSFTHKTIQSAINSVQTTETIIYIEEGVYIENLLINSMDGFHNNPIKITPFPNENVFITPKNKNKHAIDVQKSGWSLESGEGDLSVGWILTENTELFEKVNIFHIKKSFQIQGLTVYCDVNARNNIIEASYEQEDIILSLKNTKFIESGGKLIEHSKSISVKMGSSKPHKDTAAYRLEVYHCELHNIDIHIEETSYILLESNLFYFNNALGNGFIEVNGGNEFAQVNENYMFEIWEIIIQNNVFFIDTEHDNIQNTFVFKLHDGRENIEVHQLEFQNNEVIMENEIAPVIFEANNIIDCHVQNNLFQVLKNSTLSKSFVLLNSLQSDCKCIMNVYYGSMNLYHEEDDWNVIVGNERTEWQVFGVGARPYPYIHPDIFEGQYQSNSPLYDFWGNLRNQDSFSIGPFESTCLYHYIPNKCGQRSNCVGNYEGDMCNECPINFIDNNECNICKGNYDKTTSCSTCKNKWLNENNNCRTCPGNYDDLNDCKSCKKGWNIINDCNTCDKGYNEEKECLECIYGYDINNDCQTCLGNYDVYKNCERCVKNYDIQNDCETCIGNFDINYNCEICINNYDVLTQCQECIRGYDVQSGCTKCKSNFEMNNEDKCVLRNTLNTFDGVEEFVGMILVFVLSICVCICCIGIALSFCYVFIYAKNTSAPNHQYQTLRMQEI